VTSALAVVVYAALSSVEPTSSVVARRRSRGCPFMLFDSVINELLPTYHHAQRYHLILDMVHQELDIPFNGISNLCASV
jgi:hypothetical protein